jgi:IS5 family transposase
VVLMVKILILQRTFGLSDAQTELQILDRFSFQRFLGITVADPVPDQNTVWDFREALRTSGGEAVLWQTFERVLAAAGVRLTPGKIVDASFVDVPRQRNSKDENQAIRAGKRPDGWDQRSTAFLRQKDVDARWARKGDERHFGYKNHIEIDGKTKLIERYCVTSANVADNTVIDRLAEAGDGSWHADKAYHSEKATALLTNLGIEDLILRQARRGAPLTEHQKVVNRERSRIRARVEHIFGFIGQVMDGDWIRCIGQPRAIFSIALTNLTYNLHRFAFLREAAG